MSCTDAILVNDDGTRSTYVGPSLPDHLPSHVLEGLVRRRLIALGGTCPCGAVMVIPNRADRRAARKLGTALSVPIEHEDDCPAICDELLDGRWSL